VKEKESLDETSNDDMKEFAAKTKAFLTRARLQPRMVPLAGVVVQMLQQVEGALPAAKAAGELAIAFAKSDDPEVAVNAAQFSMYAGRLYESEEKTDAAAETYERVAKLLAKSDNDDIKAAAEKLLGSVRKLKLIGNPIQIEGTLVDGKSFDWSKYKGKVVLVDFWATWCGPCIQELPNVKETYEKYHDRGFDVVGISLDDDKKTLEDFLEEEKLPWPILFSSDSKATGWEHPMASYYGISAIPATILVGRDGKVVTLSARGEELGKRVAELTGAGDGEEKPKPKKSSKSSKAEKG
jgi:peroxiredoxin